MNMKELSMQDVCTLVATFNDASMAAELLALLEPLDPQPTAVTWEKGNEYDDEGGYFNTIGSVSLTYADGTQRSVESDDQGQPEVTEDAVYDASLSEALSNLDIDWLDNLSTTGGKITLDQLRVAASFAAPRLFLQESA